MATVALQPGVGARPVPRVPRLVVIGGGDIGAVYVRQLLRACDAGRLLCDRIVVVDRDPACAAAAQARASGPSVRVDAAEWDAWLDASLEDGGPDDHLVPYHWAPHLLVGWVQRQLARAGARVARGGAQAPRGLPYEADTAAGDRALSYAAWTCPVMCIEPALCPHTRGPRDWSLAGLLAGGDEAAVVFRCLHLAYGVGSIPIREITGARDAMLARLRSGPRRYVVATASHCHGLAAVLTVEPPG